jgi:flavin reductase (DIM6/NTAB) family NADH-FMN oxidoreductase RutF
MPGIHPNHFKTALGMFPSGLVVVASEDESGTKVGFTCQSFYSVSIDPPLISFSVMKTSTTYPVIRAAGKFSVSVLSQRHHAVSRQMGRRGEEKWAGVQLGRTRRGNPVLADSLMWLDCDLRDEHEAGDHLIVVGIVTEIAPVAEKEADPLLFFRGGFHRLDQTGTLETGPAA